MNQITESIIGSAFRVSNALGCGFLEKVYENALCHELRKSGLAEEQQKSLKIHYDGVIVGTYCADIFVEKAVLVELKIVDMLMPIHRAQCMNYMKACNVQVCLLLNFKKPKLEFERFVHNFRP